MTYGPMVAAFFAVFSAVPAFAATVTELAGPSVEGLAISLKTEDFSRVGNCGGGGSVVNDGCSVVMKSDPAATDAYGRYEPSSLAWVDSQDIEDLKWTATAPVAFTSLTFALTDAYNQARSHFEMFFNDGGIWKQIWDIPTRMANGNIFWLTVDFGKAVTEAEFRFTTKTGNGYDGYGISSVSVNPAPVPVPPAALLLVSGAGLLAGLRRRRKMA